MRYFLSVGCPEAVNSYKERLMEIIAFENKILRR